MARFTDPSYLRDEQYKTPSNLMARADLHKRFSTAPGSWMQWVMDQLALRPGERVLEVGGGPGWLWRGNREQLPAGLRICFSDFSLGMVKVARAGLNGASGFDYANVDVQNLPLTANVFDLVIANQMLYHVPDLPRSVQEMARALRRGGRLCAATNGWNHMREFDALLQQFDPRYPGSDKMAAAFKYRLENAVDWLNPVFAHVEVRRRIDSLRVTEAGALVDYAQSMSSVANILSGERFPELERFFQGRIEAEGGIHITKDAGVVLAWAY